jgi:hypothetical protein
MSDVEAVCCAVPYDLIVFVCLCRVGSKGSRSRVHI